MYVRHHVSMVTGYEQNKPKEIFKFGGWQMMHQSGLSKSRSLQLCDKILHTILLNLTVFMSTFSLIVTVSFIVSIL